MAAPTRGLLLGITGTGFERRAAAFSRLQGSLAPAALGQLPSSGGCHLGRYPCPPMCGLGTVGKKTLAQFFIPWPGVSDLK